MRTILLLPLPALMAVVAGCGFGATEQRTRSVPRRDLTLVTQTAATGVAIVSPVETQQLRIPRRAPRVSRPATGRAPVARISAVEPRVGLAVGAVSAPLLAEPVAQPAAMAPTPGSDRELLPGKTITLIPASSGPSVGVDPADDFPAVRGGTLVVRGGGTCRGRGRGPGIGIATAPRPDFR
jgi:hypothetical protein